jgi:hypothetical protein
MSKYSEWEGRKKLGDDLNALETALGVPLNFFSNLLDEDDWSFVIKLHALFEAACTHLLLYHFQEPELRNVVSRLPLSDRDIGKVTFLHSIGLLGARQRRLILRLSEIRNTLVHDIRHEKFTVRAMYDAYDDNQKHAFADAFSPYEALWRKLGRGNGKLELAKMIDPRTIELSQMDEMLRRASDDPKLHIWIGAYDVLIRIEEMESYSDFKQWEKARKYGAPGLSEDSSAPSEEE